VLTAQPADTASIGQVAVNFPLDAATVNTLLWLSMAAGAFLRLIISTYQGWKNNPNTPVKLDLSYWWKDNLQPKIAVILTIFTGFKVIDQYKLAETTWGVVILCLVCAIVGWFIDWAYEFLTRINQKNKIQAQKAV
jgi:hypothetical protein